MILDSNQKISVKVAKIIDNSCFEHPAKHTTTTTWSQKRIDTVTKKVVDDTIASTI